jgi:hypothetical protein
MVIALKIALVILFRICPLPLFLGRDSINTPVVSYIPTG